MRVRTVVVALAVLAAPTITALAAPAGAAKAPDSCKILKASEIEQALGGTVGAPEKGLKTAVSTSCNYDIGPSGSRPEGGLTVSVMFLNGDAAYNGLKSATGYEAVPELGKALYQPSTGALMVLKGKQLATVQGVFLTATLPITKVDAKAQLIPLAKLAAKRV